MAQASSTGPYTNHARDEVRSAGAQLSEKASSVASKAGEQLEGAMQGASDAARNVAAHGREAGERMQEVAGNLRGAVDKSVREQPMATLAVAAALGFVLGALWKS
ncbi:MAG: YqjD family protein [Hyphomicrobiaceae bacterium]